MAFSTGSFFAGVGTVFAAVTIGFAGGAMITTSPRPEPNRLERVMATPSTIPARAEEPTGASSAPPSANEVKAETNETSPAPSDRVIAMVPPPDTSARQPPANPVPAKDDKAAQMSSAGKVREVAVKREKDPRMARAQRPAEGRPPLRKRHDIEGAVNAVRQIQRDDVFEEVSQRVESPRLGFFGNE